MIKLLPLGLMIKLLDLVGVQMLGLDLVEVQMLGLDLLRLQMLDLNLVEVQMMNQVRRNLNNLEMLMLLLKIELKK